MTSGTDKQRARRQHRFTDSASWLRVGNRAKLCAVAVLIAAMIWGALAQAEETEEPVFDLNIPAMQAEPAIKELARQTGYSVLYESATVEDVRTNAVDGQYTVTKALQTLFGGTRLYGDLSQRGVITISYKQEEGTNQMVVDNDKRKKSFWGGLAAALASALTVNSAVAADGAKSQRGTLEEVIVTAQKHEQSLQDVPVAVSAFDASALEQQGINDVFDIGHFVPNLQIAETPSNSTAATIAIRGAVTVNPAITWEPPVSLYLDGVFIGKNIGGIFDIVELDRVEVLRGPQGTLYGKNTIGGAINLITRKPSGEFSGQLKATLGNKDLYSGFASIDTPAVAIGDGNLKANVGLFYKQRDGLTNNIPDPFGNPLAAPPPTSSFKEIDSEAARLSVVWEGSSVDVTYSFDYSKIQNTPTMGQLTDVLAGAGVDLLYPYLTSDSKPANAISADSSWYEDSKVMGHALQIGWDAGNWGVLGDVTLRSITAYRELTWKDTTDLDGSPLSFYVSRRNVDYEQTSQEFQIVGQTERVNYVAGMYYFKEQADNLSRGGFMLVFGFPSSHSEYGMNDGKSTAVFGQVDWRPDWSWADDRLTLSMGLRWTEEEKDQYLYRPNILPYTKANESWDNVSSTFIASWELTDEINIYGKVTEGWKAGGFNGEAPTQELFGIPYDPEEVTAYELGLKSRWLDNRLQINLAAFENKLTDMQFTVFSPKAGSGGAAATTVGNAGKATIRGFELELIAQPIEQLTINLNYGYLDPEYDEFLEVNPTTGKVVDYKDSRDFPYAAENTVSIGLQYDIGNFDWGKLTARLDWSYQDDYVPYVDPVQNSVSQIDSYDLLNARLTLSDIPIGNGQSFQVAAWGKNITGEDYRVGTIPFGLWTVSYFGEPRTYGVELTYRF